MTEPKQVLTIHIVDTELGMKWSLNIALRVVAGGYTKNVWQALDAANDALAQFAEKVNQMTGTK